MDAKFNLFREIFSPINFIILPIGLPLVSSFIEYYTSFFIWVWCPNASGGGNVVVQIPLVRAYNFLAKTF